MIKGIKRRYYDIKYRKVEGYRDIRKSIILPKEQVKLLERAKEVLESSIISAGDKGLCYLLSKVYSNNIMLFADLPKVFPLFLKANAIKYANGKDSSYWWWQKLEKYNYKDRIAFLEWMIKLTKTQY